MLAPTGLRVLRTLISLINLLHQIKRKIILRERNTNVEEAGISYSRSDVFKDEFDERIDTLKGELRNIYEDSLSDLPDELEDKFFTYNEEEEYVPDLYDGESGVEIITDAYEKRIEDRLS